MTTMTAMVLHEFGGPLVEKQVPLPTPGPGEVLVKVRACGVCYTDVKILAGKIPGTMAPPLIPGHEVAGEVVEVGAGVEGPPVGERVSVNFYLTCGVCRYCRTGSETLCTNLKGQLGRSVDGGYAQYLAVPAQNCVRLPEEVSFEHGAVLADAVATSFHAIRERARVRPGEAVGVIGIGGVGIHLVQMARLSGARVVAMDIKEKSLQVAREYGAELALNTGLADAAAKAAEFTGGEGLDAIVDTVGTQATVDLAMGLLARGGRLVLLGYDPTGSFSAEPLKMVLNEHTIMGTRAATKFELADSIRLVQAGKITAVVTESHPLAEANEMLQKLRAGEMMFRGVLLPPHDDG